MARLLALSLALCTLPASAQVQPAAESSAARAVSAPSVHRLDIQGGTVYHDGTALPSDALPDDLDIEGLSMSFEYSGPVAPAIGLNGRLYTLDGERLVALDEAEMEQQAFGLSTPEPLGQSAAEQAEAAYLQGLSERDQVLYDRLLREREMEAEAGRLAERLRQNPADAALRDQLRDALAAMFELKQENRRDEVRQVEDVLEALRLRLREREAMRDEIIEHRMRELTGQDAGGGQ